MCSQAINLVTSYLVLKTSITAITLATQASTTATTGATIASKMAPMC